MSVIEGLAVLTAVMVAFVICVGGVLVLIELMGTSTRPRPPEALTRPHRGLPSGSVIDATHRPASPRPVDGGRRALPARRP